MDRFIISIKTHIAVAVVQNHQITEPSEPVGEYDASICNRLHTLAASGADEQPFPGNATICTWTPEAVRKFPAHW